MFDAPERTFGEPRAPHDEIIWIFKLVQNADEKLGAQVSETR